MNVKTFKGVKMARPLTKDRVTFTVNSELCKQLDIYSKRFGISKSSLIESFIRDFIEASDKLFSTSENLPDAISKMMQNLSKQIDDLKDLKEGLRR